MDFVQVIGLGAAYAAAFCVPFAVLLIGGTVIAPDAMVQDYPQAIRDRYGPKSERGRRVASVMSVVMAALILAVTVLGPLHLVTLAPGSVGFWAGFWFGVAFVAVLDIIDLVVFDWVVFCTIQPKHVVLAGTEGMAEYRDYLFHVKVLFPRPVPWPILLIPIYGLLLGGVTALFSLWQ